MIGHIDSRSAKATAAVGETDAESRHYVRRVMVASVCRDSKRCRHRETPQPNTRLGSDESSSTGRALLKVKLLRVGCGGSFRPNCFSIAEEVGERNPIPENARNRAITHSQNSHRASESDLVATFVKRR
jgi:hypothetical protein